LHPKRLASSLELHETERLFEAIQEVLQRAIANNGTRLGGGMANFVLPSDAAGARNQDHLRVFRRTGEPCARCGTAVARILVVQRSTHLCPYCQALAGDR